MAIHVAERAGAEHLYDLRALGRRARSSVSTVSKLGAEHQQDANVDQPRCQPRGGLLRGSDAEVASQDHQASAVGRPTPQPSPT